MNTPRSVALWVASAWAIALGTGFGAESPASLRNGGFEEGTTAWTLAPAADYAEIGVTDDLTAPEGSKVLHFAHRRTRSSHIQQQASLAPFSYYLFSMQVRVGPYLRSGMGFWVRIWADGAESGARYSEAELSEGWQTLRFGVATGAAGALTVQLVLDRVAGDVWVDGVTVRPCRLEDLQRLIDATHPPSSSPRLGLRLPNTAEAAVWHAEIPVSGQLPSRVLFVVRRNLADDAWKASGRLCLELPAAVRVRQEPVQTSLVANGSRRLYAFDSRAIEDTSCYLDLTLEAPLGDDRRARVWAECEGGRQEPLELQMDEIRIPGVGTPREIVTGTTVYGSTLATYPDYPEMIHGLGFNHLDSWGAGFSAAQLEVLRRNGTEVTTIGPCPGEYGRLLKDEPDARSTTWTGQRVDVVDLSHHGRLREAFLADIAAYAKGGGAGMMFDDESYVDWNGMDACVCARCQAQWREWLAANCPGLAALDPAVALDDPFGHPEHYRAWWYFRAAQLTDWYRSMRAAFLAALPTQGPGPGRPLRLAIQSGGPEAAAIKSSRLNLAELAGVFDLICPQYYGGADLVARRTRELVRAVGRDKACPTLCQGERYEWQPGEFRAQILEAVFAGACGYTSWGSHYSNLRILAEAAETNGVLAQEETVLRQGAATTTFWSEAPGGRVTVLETATAGLLLVSNDSHEGTATVTVQRRAGASLRLSERFSSVTLQLAPAQEGFAVAVRPGTCTLWRWEK